MRFHFQLGPFKIDLAVNLDLRAEDEIVDDNVVRRLDRAGI